MCVPLCVVLCVYCCAVYAAVLCCVYTAGLCCVYCILLCCVVLRWCRAVLCCIVLCVYFRVITFVTFSYAACFFRGFFRIAPRSGFWRGPIRNCGVDFLHGFAFDFAFNVPPEYYFRCTSFLPVAQLVKPGKNPMCYNQTLPELMRNV